MDQFASLFDKMPGTKADLRNAAKQIWQQMDQLAADPDAYSKFLKQTAEGAGVDLPDEFVSRVAAPLPPELEDMPITASVPLVRPADVISVRQPTLAVLHIRATPPSGVSLPSPPAAPGAGADAAACSRWLAACQFAMQQWRDPAVQDTAAPAAAPSNVTLTPGSAAASTSTKKGSSSSSSGLKAAGSRPLPKVHSAVLRGQRVLVHFFLEVHPLTVKFAVRDSPKGVRAALLVQAARWLQQQRQQLPAASSSSTPFRFDLPQLQYMVHPKFAPADKVAAASAAAKQHLQAAAVEGTSAASLPKDLVQQLVLDAAEPHSATTSSKAAPAALNAANARSQPGATGLGTAAAAAAAAAAAQKSVPAGSRDGSRIEPRPGQITPAAAAASGSSKAQPSTKQQQQQPGRRLIQVLGSDSDDDSDAEAAGSQANLAASSAPAGTAGLIQEVVAAAEAAEHEPLSLGVEEVQLPSSRASEGPLLIKAVTTRRVQQQQEQSKPAQQMHPGREQQQGQLVQQVQPASKQPLLSQQQPQQQLGDIAELQSSSSSQGKQHAVAESRRGESQALQGGAELWRGQLNHQQLPTAQQLQQPQQPTVGKAATYKVGFVTKEGCRHLRVVVTGLSPECAPSLQVDALPAQHQVQLAWSPAVSTAAAAAAGGGAGGQSQPAGPQQGPAASKGTDLWSDPVCSIEATAALLGLSISAGTAGGPRSCADSGLGPPAIGSAHQDGSPQGGPQQQQQQLMVQLPPVAVGRWAARFDSKHRRLVLEAAVL